MIEAPVQPSYLVNEIYECLQGEGLNVGVPSILVRLQVCNLRCTWCDTPYTHTVKSDPDSANPSKQRTFRLKLDELVARIKSFENTKHVILSGGEPTLQNLAPIARALGSGFSIEVETNGTQIPHRAFQDFQMEDYERFQWNVSPKGQAAGQELVPAALEHWSTLGTKTERVYFKFVVRRSHANDDLTEVVELCSKFKIPRKNVFLMAEGTTIESQVDNVWLHDLCLKEGFRYSPRLHVILFGNRRGV